jgi:hypothetical protein
MAKINTDLLERLPLAEIGTVVFYKRNEVTTDLICCDVRMASGEVWTFHEELVGWSLLVQHLEGLPGFDSEWFASVSQPPFACSGAIAFGR